MTFKDTSTVVCLTYDIWKALLSYASDKNIPIYNKADYTPDRYSAYPNLTFLKNELCGSSHNKRLDIGRDWISIEEFIEYCDNYEKEQPIKLSLTNDYDAVVDKVNKIVNVGCQKIPFSKVEELYKLIN